MALHVFIAINQFSILLNTQFNVISFFYETKFPLKNILKK